MKHRRKQINIFFNTNVQDETGGVALILVIWVMVVLIAIVGEFSYSMRTEINIVRNFKEEEEAYQLALAGIESAKIEILSAKEPAKMYINENDILIFDPDDEEPVRKDNLGKGTFKYIISDEDGKLNINTASIEQLKYVFEDSGVDDTDAKTIAHSIIDWRDTNDLHHEYGAEEDYYKELEPPYSCKDGPFDSVEELLLVKGMTPEIFYGSSKIRRGEKDAEEENVYDGVAQYLTVNGFNRININTAPKIVLEAVLGTEIANNIIMQREDGPISRSLGGGKLSSVFFTIISTGANIDGKIKRSIKTILQKKEKSFKTVYWNDNIIG